jgi:hypothetical protein
MFVYNDDDQIINTPRYEEYQRLFSEAGQLAVAENKRLGIPLSYVENDQIIRDYADGRKEVLGTVPPDVKYNGPLVIDLSELPDA